MLVLLMDELRDMELDDDEDEGKSEGQANIEQPEDSYEFKKPARVYGWPFSIPIGGRW